MEDRWRLRKGQENITMILLAVQKVAKSILVIKMNRACLSVCMTLSQDPESRPCVCSHLV